MNSILERLRADGTWTRMYEQWLHPTSAPPSPPPAVYGRNSWPPRPIPSRHLPARPRTLPAPPVPPGALTHPPSSRDVREFLERLHVWTDELGSCLDRLDADAQLATGPDAYAGDISLAMSLRQSVTSRHDELVAVWDSGRTGPDELARIAVLLWGRLTDPLGGPSAFTLTEAGTLVAALTDRIAGALVDRCGRRLGRRGTDRAAPGRAGRCRSLAEVLGRPTDRLDALAARLESAVAEKDRARITATVAELEPEVAGIERDLIKDTGLRTSTARLAASNRARYDVLGARADALTALAERSRSRIAGFGDVPVPSMAALGPPAAPPDATAGSDQWRTARADFERYGAALDQVDEGLAAAEAHYRAPLRARDDLRGLLGAYATRAARSALAEDPVVTTAYRAARRRALVGSLRPEARGAARGGIPARGARGDRCRAGRRRHDRRRPDVSAEQCQEAGCTGTIEDGYCNVCGAPASSGVVSPTTSPSTTSGSTPVRTSISTKLASTPIGSARAGLSRPTRRLVTASSRVQHLGAGITNVPATPIADPRSIVLTDPSVPEEKRFCSACARPSGVHVRAPPDAPKASARSVGRRTRSRRSCMRVTSSVASTPWSAASRTADSAGSTSPATTTSRTGTSCSRVC